MTALAADRNTPSKDGVLFSFPVKQAAVVFAGAIVVLDGGYAKPAVTGTGLRPVGRAEEYIDNSLGLDGAKYVKVRRGVFRYRNSSGDAITLAEIGQACFLVDDQTVAKTSDSAARSIAGTVVDVDDKGVWVEIGWADSASNALLAANNLGDVAAAATARSNLGLAGASAAGAAAGTGVTAAEQAGAIRRTTLTLASLAVTMTDATTAGCHGSQKVYDFPAGVIQVLGATTDLTVSAAAGIGATAAVVGSIGTAAVGTDNATLSGTEADIVPSTAAALTGSAGAMKGKSNATTMAAGVWDGTSAAKDAYLNFAVPDADATGNGTLTVSGTITLVWVNHGDN